MDIKEFIKSLSPLELDITRATLQELKEKHTSANGSHGDNIKSDVTSCPHCGHTHVMKFGKSPSGQRYRCCNPECNRTFQCTTDTFFAYSKVDYDHWMAFIGAEILGLTLRQESDILNVSVTTCFNLRHKLYASISEEQFKNKLHGTVEVDSVYASINLSGFKKEDMPRASKHRGKHKPYSTNKELRGISHHKVCLVSAVDENDNIVFQIAGLGPESIDKYETIKESFSENCTLITDSKSCFDNFAKTIKAKLKMIPTDHFATEDGETLATLNQIHQEFGEMLRRKRGVGTRHLQGYTDWLIFIKRLKYRVEALYRKIDVYQRIQETEFKLKTNDICKMELPISLKEAYKE